MRVVASRLVSHAVDAVAFIWFAIGVNHRGASSSTREAFFLAMPLLVAIPADDVKVAGVVAVTGLTIVAGRIAVVSRRDSAVAGLKCSNLFNFLFSQLFPDDLTGVFWLKLGFDSSDLVKPLMVVLNGLQVAGHFHALVEGGFFSLQDFVAEAILKSSEKKQMLDELEGI
jgi:hypothetical protein